MIQKARDKDRQLEARNLIDSQLETDSKSKGTGEATRGENSDWFLIRNWFNTHTHRPEQSKNI